ncbi:MAG: ABC transporter substrate-binding protein [Defluviitaleaceae bacterium]|nr:ABC transporter substrate-binding protein [Defluviitaleaceae bacterium]
MKKFAIIVSLLLVAMLAFTACNRGGSDTPPPPPAPPTPSPTPAATPTPAPDAGHQEPEPDPGFVMPTTPITLTFWWWGGDARNAAVEAAVDIFMDRYPNITIEVQPTTAAFADATEAMLTRVAAGTEADINQVNFNWVHLWGRGENVFADLRDFDHIIDFSQFSQSDIDSMTLGDGQIAGLPHGMNARMLLTSRPFLEEFGLTEMPTDFEEFIALAERISANNAAVDAGDNRYVHVPFSNLDIDHFLLTMLYSTTGKEPVANRRWNYTADEVERVLNLLLRFDAAGGQPSFENHDTVNSRNNAVWTGGRAASSFQWINAPHVDAGTYGGGDRVGEMVLFPFPQPGGNVVGAARASLAHAISKNSAHPEVAAYFLNFFYTDPEAIRAVGPELGVPGARDAFAIVSSEGMINELQAQGIELLNRLPVAFMTVYWEDSTLRNPRYAIYDELRTERITAREAAERMVREQQDALDNLYR